VIVKLAAAVLVAGSTLLAAANTIFGNHAYTVTAYFLSAEGLVPQNDVVINGAHVGEVVSVSLAPADSSSEGGARVVMQIDKEAPLHQGTRATIRPKGLLGNMFVQLDPGSPANGAIPSGGTLPLQDTASPVDLDQVMDLFDSQTQAYIRTLTREGGTSLQNRGPDLNALLSALPGISQDTAAVTGKIAAKDQQLSALNVEFDRIAAMMAAEDQAFRRDLANGGAILDTMAAHDRQLQDELTFADLTLAELEAGLRGHEGDLNQVLREMPALLAQLTTLSNHSATSLAILGPCVSDIDQTISEMASANAYRDASGNAMLRVHPYIPAPGHETTTMAGSCSGGP
jgi:phospholipid/cholesterol/gamma-HCH transport system substrate-binding protein